MRDKVVEAVRTRFQSYHDLFADIDEELIGRSLDVPKTKTLSVHVWCVVGARESYTRGLAHGEWQGFASSLEAFDRASILAALETSAEGFERTVESITDWTEARESLLHDLHEHEVMHEGQIIRLVYGFGESLPESWKWA